MSPAAFDPLDFPHDLLEAQCALAALYAQLRALRAARLPRSRQAHPGWEEEKERGRQRPRAGGRREKATGSRRRGQVRPALGGAAHRGRRRGLPPPTLGPVQGSGRGPAPITAGSQARRRRRTRRRVRRHRGCISDPARDEGEGSGLPSHGNAPDHRSRHRRVRLTGATPPMAAQKRSGPRLRGEEQRTGPLSMWHREGGG